MQWQNLEDRVKIGRNRESLDYGFDFRFLGTNVVPIGIHNLDTKTEPNTHKMTLCSFFENKYEQPYDLFIVSAKIYCRNP
jgi:hypothetical protein